MGFSFETFEHIFDTINLYLIIVFTLGTTFEQAINTVYDKLFKMFLTLLISFGLIVNHSNSEQIASLTIQNIENQLDDISSDEYWDYYDQIETIRELDEQNEQRITERKTMFEILWPLIKVLAFGSISMTVILVVFCVCGVLVTVDWMSLLNPLEYLPCFNYQLLQRKLELYKSPGAYLRQDGTKEYYQPIIDEGKIYKQIQQLFYNNC